MLQEKYDFNEQDAKDMADFLVPLLDFVPEKRPTAAECLGHPWLTAGPLLLEPSTQAVQSQAIDEKKREKDEREAMEAGVGNIAIDRISQPLKEKQETQLSSPRKKCLTS